MKTMTAAAFAACLSLGVAAPVAEDLARYIAEQHLDKPVVIGHSMGGTIGMMLAARIIS